MWLNFIVCIVKLTLVRMSFFPKIHPFCTKYMGTLCTVIELIQCFWIIFRTVRRIICTCIPISIMFTTICCC